MKVKASEVVAALEAGKLSVLEIAKKFGVTPQNVYYIRKKHITTAKAAAPKAAVAKPKSKKVTKPKSKKVAKPVPKAEDQDMVNHPAHYTVGGIETIDFIEAKQLGYHVGNAVKYLSRGAYKGRNVEDLKKAVWYILREIDRIEGGKA